jgi:hypothetical protein
LERHATNRLSFGSTIGAVAGLALPFAVGSGTITIDSQKKTATLSLQIERDATKVDFVGNGRWRIKKAK